MKRKFLSFAVFACVAASVAIISCKKEEEKTEESTTTETTDSTTTSANSGGTTTDTTTNSGGTTTPATTSSYTFSDDGLTCTPYSTTLSINNGILSVVSNPCQSASAKLDGYFKFGKKPAAGTYNIRYEGFGIGNTPAYSTTDFSLIFYQHNSKDWYAKSGTVTLTQNNSDTTKLDLTWKDVEMISTDSSTTKFSGTLLGIK